MAFLRKLRISSSFPALAIVSLFALAFPCIVAGQEEQKSATVASESSQAALTLFAEAADYQNNQQFDLAATEWTNFLRDFKDDPKVEEARYHLAVCQLQENDFENAIKNLQTVREHVNADFERLQDTYLNLGWAQYSLALQNQPKLFDQAATTFAKLLSDFPKSEFRDQALFFGGESLYLQGKKEEAAASYAALVENHPQSELRGDAMYALGVTHQDLLHYQEAGTWFEKFLESFPDHDLRTEVRMRKAETVLQLGDFANAEKIFGEVAATDGFKDIDHARYRQAFCVAQQGRNEEAGKLFASIAEEMSDSPYAADAGMAAGRAYYRAKQFEPAIAWFKKIESTDSPHAPEAAHWHARILLDQDQPAAARELVAAVLAAAKDHPFLVSLKLDDADALYEMEATRKESVAAYAKIADEHGEHQLAPKALYNAAYGAMETGDYRIGLKHAQTFFERHGQHSLRPEVQKVVAECKLQLGELDEAAAEFADLAQTGDEDGTRFQLRSGLSLFLKKDYDQAIKVLSQVATGKATAEEKAEAFYWLGRSFAGKEQYSKSVQAYEASQTAMSNWRQADEVLLNLARAMRDADRLDEAKSTVTRLIAAYPKSEVLDQAHYRLAEFSYASSDYQQAIESYSHVVADWPQSKFTPFSLYGRGWSELRSGQPGKAVEDFALLLKEFPDHELSNQATYALAMSKHQAGNHEEAIKDADRFLESNPDANAKSDAVYLQGLCLIGLKQQAAAIERFQELLRDAPDYGSADKVLYEMAWALKNTGQDAEATEAFKRLLQSRPDSSLAGEANYHIGESLYAAKEFGAAVKQYEASELAAKSTDLLEKARYKLAWSHYQLSQFEKALAAFQSQLEATRETDLAADAQFMCGECLFKLKKYQEALEVYRLAKQLPSKNQTMQVLTYLHAAQSASQLKEWAEGVRWTSELVETFPATPYLPQAKYEQGWARRNLGELDPALALFEEVVKTGGRSELGARARFMGGEVLFEKKDYSAAIVEFRKVMFGYGAETAPPGIKRWQAKAAFEAGRCAAVLAGQEQNPQRRSQLIEGARGFFRYVSDKHDKSDEAGPARQQLERLGA